jgi:hypothetical protein
MSFGFHCARNSVCSPCSLFPGHLLRYSFTLTRIGALTRTRIRVCFLLDMGDIMSHKLNGRKIFDF